MSHHAECVALLTKTCLTLGDVGDPFGHDCQIPPWWLTGGTRCGVPATFLARGAQGVSARDRRRAGDGQ